MDEKELETKHLIQAVTEAGFPAEFGEILASELGGPWSLRRMSAWIYRARPTSMEQVADELVAILEERHRIVDKITTEQANAGWNEFLNRPNEE